MSTAKMDLDHLRRWHEEYIATHPTSIGRVLLALEDSKHDHLDTIEVEEKIQLAALQTVVSKGFCGECSHLLKNWPNMGRPSYGTVVVGPHSTFEMEARSRQGCKLCSFVLTLLNHKRSLDVFRKIEKRLELLSLNTATSFTMRELDPDGNVLISVNLPGKPTMLSGECLGLGLDIQSDITLPYAYHEKEPDKWDTAVNWMHTCRQRHSSCRHVVSNSRPTRLVSISNNTVRLVLTADWVKMPSYATLSYSWGRHKFLRLTTNTMSLFLHTIPFEEMPRLFQDAIRIARRLGFEYLWIDALCIVQDSQDSADWHRESGLMRYIYGVSDLNIAMTTTESAHDAYPTPNPLDRGGFVARVEMNDRCQIRSFYAMGAFEAATTESPLARRAWTLQERLLAPRTIYFSPSGIFWECRCIMASEFIPSGLAGIYNPRLVRPLDNAWLWDDIVRTYSRGNLTNSSDKLPALSGIARRQHEITGDEYLAGMWKTQLFEQLTWRAMGESIRPKWRAPTWSWTSIDGSVGYTIGSEYEFSERHDYCRVLHASTVPAGSDPFGAVSAAELQLSCSGMIRGYFDSALVHHGIAYITPAAESYALAVVLDAPQDDAHKMRGEVYLLPLFERGYRLPPPPAKRESSANSEEAGDDKDTEFEEEAGLICGLVLQKQDPIKRTFQRMGNFECRSNPAMSTVPDVNTYYAFLHTFEECGSSTARSECTEVLPSAEHPGFPYMVSIV